MMLEIEPITNISLAALNARRKEIRAIIWKPSARLPAIPRFKPLPINCIPYTSLPSLAHNQINPSQVNPALQPPCRRQIPTAANRPQYRCGGCGIPHHHR